jgi:hypothetical protein
MRRIIDRYADRWRRRRHDATGAVRPAPPYILLVAALVGGGTGFALVRSSTATPEVDFRGDITVFVSDPRASVTINALFYEYAHDTWDRGISPTFENAGAVSLDLRIAPGATEGPVGFVVMFTGDARLSPVRPSARFHIAEATDTMTYLYDGERVRTDPGRERQVVVGRFDPGRQFPASVIGRLTRPVSDTEAGVTFVQLPSMTTERWSATFGERYGAPGVWHRPASAEFTASMGVLPDGTVVESADPEPDRESRRALEWSSTGRELDEPRATVVDRSAQQRAAGRLFAAGALAGIAGGLLVELVSRGVSSHPPAPRRRPRSYRVRPDSVRLRRR